MYLDCLFGQTFFLSLTGAFVPDKKWCIVQHENSNAFKTSGLFIDSGRRLLGGRQRCIKFTFLFG